MNGNCHDGCKRETVRRGSGGSAAFRLVDWLHFAATPTFLLMALLTAGFSGGESDMLCSAMHNMSPLGGMTLMYLLMGAFHSTPWLRLISNRMIRASKKPAPF